MKKRAAALFTLALIALPLTAFPLTNTNKSPVTNNVFLAEFYEGSATNQGAEAGGASSFWSIVNIILYTAIFGVVAYFVVRLIVRKSALPVSEDKQVVDIILTKTMGLSSYLQIVKIGKAYYLFSLGSDGLKLLDKIEDKETIDFIELNRDSLKPKETKFFDILSFFPPGKKIDKLDFMRQQKDKLKKM
ncbi:MAG: hypothetical protein A2Y33_11810 [Spirochaetes bacterium GWF1_51_8]|nr:MAG: hypothetical protein A2Y33_11810 [Spirochaetes bacterium GWF1_51_8]